MRLILAAFLMGGLLCTPVLATEKPPVDAKAVPAKPDAAKPEAGKPVVHVPAQPVDYGDMRCGFAVRRKDVLDGQIIAWAGGFIEGYAKANPEHFGSARSITELTDPAVLRTHIRGYCLKHGGKSIEAAVLAMVPRTHGATAPAAPTPHAAPK